MTIDVALVTCSAFPQLDPRDGVLRQALAALGLNAQPAVWNDAAFRFEDARLVLIRSAWDSHLHSAAFQAWADRVGADGLLHNPPELVRWNLHKRYLQELDRRGVPVTPTVWVNQGDTVDMRELMRERAWPRIVLKPAISASANGTAIFDAAAADAAQAAVEELARSGDVMIQPYLAAFETEGERSYVFIDGTLTHAVRRPPTLRAASRGFSEPEPFEPLGRELDIAANALAAVPHSPLYARVDIATNNDGMARVQEVELIEPCLFLSLAPRATDILARAVAARLK